MSKRVSKQNKFGDKSRFYELPNGKQVPSVTTILGSIGKPALVAWAAKVEREMVIEVSANLYETIAETPRMSKLAWLTTLADRLGKTKASQKELAKASEIGSQAHAWIEWEIKRQLMHDVGKCPAISPQAQLAVSAWERWKDSVNFKPLLCEQAVWSHFRGYAGTMDLLAEINGEVTLLDWKTGKHIYEEAYLQNAAYRWAVHEMRLLPDPQPDIKGMIVRLPKVETDPEFEVKAVPGNIIDLMDVFTAVHKLWKFLNAKEELTDSPEVRTDVSLEDAIGTNGPPESNTGAVLSSPAAP